MSASPEQVMPIVRDIEHFLAGVEGISIVLETNKKIVVWCPNQTKAKHLGREIQFNTPIGADWSVRKGLKTDAYYLALYL